MNNLFNRLSDPDATAIRERIFNVLPVLIATDGYVGLGRHDLLAKLDRTRVVVALTDSGHAADLRPWVDEMIQLPKP
jgi:hypothetical protein